jgi:hypothetical protein
MRSLFLKHRYLSELLSVFAETKQLALLPQTPDFFRGMLIEKHLPGLLSVLC